MTDPPPSPPRGGAYIAMSDELRVMSNEFPTVMLKRVQHDSMHNVILNLVQDLSADWEIKARSEMLKRVQHDNKISPNKLGSALA